MKKIFTILFAIFSHFLFSQKTATYIESKLILEEKIKSAVKTDSLIEKNIENYNRYLAEGSNTMMNRKNKQIGIGGFSVYVISEKANKKLIKIQYSGTIHMDESFKNSELLEFDIYFDDHEIAIFSKISEYHYTNNEVISSYEYFINLPKDDKKFAETYHSNPTIKSRIKEINEIVADYRNKK